MPPPPPKENFESCNAIYCCHKKAMHLPAHWPMSNDVPRPLVVDFPGWTENMIGHERDSMFYVVADEDEEGGFLLVTPKGMGDVGDGKVE